MPVKDVYKGFIFRKDNHIVAVIRVQPKNIHLLSLREQKRAIKKLEEVLNGLDYPFQIFTIARPVDLDAYMQYLENLRQNAPSFLKQRLLSGYIQHAATMASNGEALERQFYILLDQPLGKKPQMDEKELLKRANELALNLTSADLFSHVCTDEELRELLFIFLNPNYASFERSPISSIALPSIYEGVEE